MARSARHPQAVAVACNHHHYTYANLCRDGRVGVALLAPPNIAVRVLGRARLVRERMDTGELLAILEIGIEEAKNDMMRWSSIESAFGFVPPADLEDYFVGAIAKLEDMWSKKRSRELVGAPWRGGELPSRWSRPGYRDSSWGLWRL